MSLLFVASLAMLAAAAFFAAEAVTVPSRERRTSVRRAATYGRVRKKGGVPSREQFRERAVVPFKETLARWVLRATPKLNIDAVAAKLLTAGLTRRLSPTGYLSLKGALAIGGILVGFIFGGGILVPLLAAAAGFFAPDVYVTMKARRRKEEARTQLPDALDILAVSVEAGLAFDGAVAKLIEHMRGPLPEEFALTLGEMRIGRGRHEALKNLAERLDTPEVTAFTRAVIQADQLGMSLGRILRVQASDARQRRQAEAEEKAMKAPIKMIPPTAIFIFPAIFIVAIGPVFLNLGNVF